MIFLDVEDLLHIAERATGAPVDVRDIGLLAAAAARPRASAFGADAYPTLHHKAAALLHSIVKNHALVDGNKRLGWLATAVFLEINGSSVAGASNEAVYDLVMDVAASAPAVEQIAAALEDLTGRRSPS